jgi:3-hydroxyisobutyrate dehydrogenase-like beta-hydroxyacid dehydrogenase
MAKARIGFVGVGLMGHGICKNLLGHGHEVRVLPHVRRDRIEDLLSRGAVEMDSLGALVAASDIVMTCLPDVATVRSIFAGDAGLLAVGRPGLVLVDCSTSDPALTEQLGRQAASVGMTLVDAPLMRGPREAWAGELNVIAGGEAAAVESLRPVFSCFAKQIFHVGPLGHGHRVKVLNNVISMCNLAVVAEAFTAAARLGVDRQMLLDVVSSGNANSRAVAELGPRLIADDHGMSFSVNVGLKDIGLFRSMAGEAGSVTLLADAARTVFWLTRQMGYGSENASRIGTALGSLAEGVQTGQTSTEGSGRP